MRLNSLIIKVRFYGISLKDRGAILPAGHTADGAFWLNNEAQWITSTFYMQELPKYVEEINANNPAYTYLQGKMGSRRRVTQS